ncbi:MAG: hypothetical protein ACHQAQ_03725 [Hyphomicrobiales bacterium]
MSILGFGFLSIDGDLPAADRASPRLRDLIAGLRSGDIAAAALLERLDPNLSDEVRALVAHRGIAAERFLADVLIAFALDIADEAWRRVMRRGDWIAEDVEAAALGDLLTQAMHRMLLRGLRLAGETANPEPPATPGRRVG